jgi:hypothetical protein
MNPPLVWIATTRSRYVARMVFVFGFVLVRFGIPMEFVVYASGRTDFEDFGICWQDCVLYCAPA